MDLVRDGRREGDGSEEVTDRVDLGARNRAALTHIANGIRGEMDVARALKVMARYPLYTLWGAHRHARLNEDMFEKKEAPAE